MGKMKEVSSLFQFALPLQHVCSDFKLGWVVRGGSQKGVNYLIILPPTKQMSLEC